MSKTQDTDKKESDIPGKKDTLETPLQVITNGAVNKDTESLSDREEEANGDAPSENKGGQSPLASLMARTGYSIVQQNGQRRYGPPPGWDGTAPKRGCEVFVGKIPRDCFEDELVPVFEKAGRIYEMRLMMDYNGQNRGYAFVVYCSPIDAKESVKILNNLEIRQGRTLGVCMSVDNCRLFIGGIPKRVSKEDIREEMEKVTEGVVDVIVYPSASDKTKNRGFAFVEYESHRAAAMARRKFMNGRVQLWNHQIAIDWAEPELEVDEEIMAQVKVLYVRNLMLSTTELQITEAFAKYSAVERVKKIRDYAFVHFHARDGALKAMNSLNGSLLDGAEIEVTLAKPVDKENYPKNPRLQRQVTAVPTFGFLPVDYSLLPALYSGYFPSSAKYLPRNSMGAKVVRSPRNAKGKPRNFYPVTFSPQLVFPASPVHGPFVSQYMESPKRSQISDEALYDIIPGVDLSPAPPPHQAPPPHTTPPTAVSVKPIKSTLQILEEVCGKNNWGQPLYTLYSASPSPEGQLFQYKVFIPALGTTYIPSKFSRTTEEAQCAAAEYSLIQLGYPLEATGYTPPRGLPSATPMTPETAMTSPFTTHSYVTLQNTSKHTHGTAAWSPDASLFTGYDTSFPPPHHPFQPTEMYHRNF